MAETKYITLENMQEMLDEVGQRVVKKEEGKGLSTNDLTNELKAKYDQAAQKVESLESAGAEANVIETVKVNGSPLSPDGSKAVNITVPTKVSQITNDSGFQTSAQVTSAINSKIASVYKPGGSVAFASLPELTASVLGKVYNVTDAFTTTADFMDGSGKKYPAGTNVVVVDAGSGSYKFDVLAGFVDLSGYATTSAMTSAVSTAKSEAVTSANSSTDTKLASYPKKTEMTSAISTAKTEAINSANSSTDGKLANYVKSADLVPATSEEIQALFSGWDS